MADQTMHVLPRDERPGSSAIIHAPPKGKLAYSGDGPDRLLCGECGQPLAEGVSEGQLFGVLIECPECGAMNDLKP
jgi:ribosomal protein S27AE